MMKTKVYHAGDMSFELKLSMPIEDEFMVAVEAVNHYLVEDHASGELYVHPLLKRAWCVKLFMQYHTNLAVETFEADGRKAIYVLLQWAEDHDVLKLDEDMERCFARFHSLVQEAEQTMLQRHAQCNSAGNQLRKLLNFIELRDESGNGGWELLRNVIAEHMLDEQEAQRAGNIVDMRMFGKMKGPKPE